MTDPRQDLEARILQKVLDRDSAQDPAGVSQVLFWRDAPDFFGMAPAIEGGVETNWSRLNKTLRQMLNDGFLTGTVTVNQVRDLQVGPRGVNLLKELEVSALEAEKRKLEAEQAILKAAQKAAHDERDAVFRGKQELAQAQKALRDIQTRLRAARDDLEADRAAFLEEKEALATEKDEIERTLAEERAEFERVLAERQAQAAAEALSASRWRSAGLLSLLAGGLLALLAATQAGFV